MVNDGLSPVETSAREKLNVLMASKPSSKCPKCVELYISGA